MLDFDSISINWPSFIPTFWLFLLLKALGNIYIVIICFPVYEVMNSNQVFSYNTKIVGTKIQKLNLNWSW